MRSFPESSCIKHSVSSWTARLGRHTFECSCPTLSRTSQNGREARGPEACRCQGWSWLAPRGRPLPPHPTSLNLQPHLKSKTWVSTLLTDRNTLQLAIRHDTSCLPPTADLIFLFGASLSSSCPCPCSHPYLILSTRLVQGR